MYYIPCRVSNKGLYTEVNGQVFVREEWDLDTAAQFTTGWVTEVEGEGGGGGGGEGRK